MLTSLLTSLISQGSLNFVVLQRGLQTDTISILLFLSMTTAVSKSVIVVNINFVRHQTSCCASPTYLMVQFGSRNKISYIKFDIFLSGHISFTLVAVFLAVEFGFKWMTKWWGENNRRIFWERPSILGRVQCLDTFWMELSDEGLSRRRAAPCAAFHGVASTAHSAYQSSYK